MRLLHLHNYYINGGVYPANNLSIKGIKLYNCNIKKIYFNPNLQLLHIEKCKIGVLPILILYENLKNITLTNNNMVELDISVIPDNIEYLTIHEPNLIKLPSFAHMQHLKHFFIDGASLFYIDSCHLPKSLTTISFVNCQLNAVPDVSTFYNLISINFSGNHLHTVNCNRFPCMLRHLNLSDCALVRIYNINKLACLETLYIYNNPKLLLTSTGLPSNLDALSKNNCCIYQT